jgi:hypothetical protein
MPGWKCLKIVMKEERLMSLGEVGRTKLGNWSQLHSKTAVRAHTLPSGINPNTESTALQMEKTSVSTPLRAAM